MTSLYTHVGQRSLPPHPSYTTRVQMMCDRGWPSLHHLPFCSPSHSNSCWYSSCVFVYIRNWL